MERCLAYEKPPRKQASGEAGILHVERLHAQNGMTLLSQEVQQLFGIARTAQVVSSATMSAKFSMPYRSFAVSF